MSKADSIALREWYASQVFERCVVLVGENLSAITIFKPGTHDVAFRVYLPWDWRHESPECNDYRWQHFANLEAEIKRWPPLPDHVAKAVADLIAAMREAYGVGPEEAKPVHASQSAVHKAQPTEKNASHES
jgi:hypothetical protein